MKKTAIRGAAVAAAAGVAMVAMSTGAANADTLLNLGTTSTTQKVGSANVTITLKNHTAKLSPGMVALPTTRNAWVSGVVSVKVDGKAKSGSIGAGYIVGCQVNIGGSIGAKAPLDSGVGVSSDNGLSFTPSAKVTTSGAISLAAGEVAVQPLTVDRATWPSPGDEISPDWSAPSNGFKFSGTSGSLSYADQTIGVDQCAGYAQAKFFAKVKVTVGDTQSTLFLWGKPFTLG